MSFGTHPAARVDVKNVAALLRHSQTQVPVDQRPDVPDQRWGSTAEPLGRPQAAFDLVTSQRHVIARQSSPAKVPMHKSDRPSGRLNVDR